MTTEYTSRMRALDRISRSIAEHQPTRREHGVGSTCKNPACRGVIFLTLNDRHNHQAVVLANDLQSELDWYLEVLRDDADEGREVTEEELASARSEYLVLAPSAPTPVAAPSAEAWDKGVATALNHAILNEDGITLRLEHLDGRPWANPYRAASIEGEES